MQQALIEDIAFRFLSGNQQPRYWALIQFHARHRTALSNLCVQSVRLAAGAGLVKLRHVAIDGSKLKANASLSKAMSYGRMTTEEQRLRDESDAYPDACDEIDAAEDEEFGPDHDGQELPKHRRTREGRLEAIRRAKEDLEREAKERSAHEQEARRQQAMREGRTFHPRTNPNEVKPRGREQRNFATALVAPGRITHDEWRNERAPKSRIPKHLTRRERMKRLLSTKTRKAKYLLRQITAEPGFGQIKHTRNHQVHHRGLVKVHAYWRFDCVVHNFLKLFRCAPHLAGVRDPLNHCPHPHIRLGRLGPSPTSETEADRRETAPATIQTGF